MTAFEALKRSWHDRSSIDELPTHLESKYGIHVKSVTKLDGGVFRVYRDDGHSWIARVFPSTRRWDQAEGDAAVLRFLEVKGFPAERLADPIPVSELDGQTVLVTRAVTGTPVKPSAETYRAMGDGLGVLASYNDLPAGVDRPAGALHLWSVNGGGHANELAAAREWMEEARPGLTGKKAELCRSLLTALQEADDCSDLPHCLVHPDPALKNVLSSKKTGATFIDWTGAGRGPRVSSLANLFWQVVIQSKGGAAGVTEVIRGYREHVDLDRAEIERLAAALRIRGFVYAAYILANGKTAFPTVDEQIAFSNQVAAHAKAEFARS